MPDLRRADTPATAAPTAPPVDDWVHELIALTRPGVEIASPSRMLRGRVIPFEYDDFS